MSYIPKVGDEIKSKCGLYKYTILSIVNNIIIYFAHHNSTIKTTQDFENSFDKTRLIFPKEKFVPKCGDRCYYPLYDYSNDTKYSVFDWGGSMGINRQHAMLDNGLLFATEEEVIEARDKMIACLK